MVFRAYAGPFSLLTSFGGKRTVNTVNQVRAEPFRNEVDAHGQNQKS